MVLGAAEALHALAVGAAARIDVLRDRRRADKADGLDVRVVEDRVDGDLVAIYDIEDAGRQPGLDEQFGNAHRHARVALGRLQDEGVAAGDGGRNLPQRDHGREVEGRDAGDHAERLAHRIDVDAGAGAVGEFALHHVRRADAYLDHFEAALNVALGVGDRLAMFAGKDLGEFVVLAVHQFKKFHQHAHAALRIGRCPGRLGRLGVFDGGAHLGSRRQGHGATNAAVHRLKNLMGLPAGAGDALAADEVAVFDHGLLPERHCRCGTVALWPTIGNAQRRATVVQELVFEYEGPSNVAVL